MTREMSLLCEHTQNMKQKAWVRKESDDRWCDTPITFETHYL